VIIILIIRAHDSQHNNIQSKDTTDLSRHAEHHVFIVMLSVMAQYFYFSTCMEQQYVLNTYCLAPFSAAYIFM
jgi:hypothetical protein